MTMKNKKIFGDVLLVGYNSSNENGVPVLVVGRKRPNESIDILKAFCGEEAKTIYDKLINTEEKNE